MDLLPNHIELPRPFYSDATRAPFERCLGCDVYLREPGTQYVIEKAFRRYEGFNFQDTVFEYAMCLDCMIKLQETMSQESMERVRLYFEKRVDLYERRERLMEQNPVNPEDWISSCIVTGEPVASMTEYQIYGHCDGDQLLFTVLPYAIGGAAIDELGGLLSNKTLGEIDGFMEDHFGLPPELRKLLLDNKLLVV